MTAFIQFFEVLCAASELLKALCSNRMCYSAAQGSYTSLPFLKFVITLFHRALASRSQRPLDPVPH